MTHHSQSTYNGYDNNPIFWADPSGADVEQIEGGTSYTGNDAKNMFIQLQAQLGGSENNNDERDGSNKSNPLDVIFKNNNGDEIGRIVLPGADQIVNVDTDKKPLSPIKIEPNLENDIDAVGFNVEFSYTFGGGMHGGVGFVYFLKGANSDELWGIRF